MKHQFATVQRILGALLMLFSISMLIPLALAVFYGEGGAAAFALAFAISSGAGLVAWLPVRHTTNDLKIRDGFLVVVLFYIVLGGFGSLPDRKSVVQGKGVQHDVRRDTKHSTGHVSQLREQV